MHGIGFRGHEPKNAEKLWPSVNKINCKLPQRL